MVSDPAIDLGMQETQDPDFTPVGMCPEVDLLNHIVAGFLIFRGTSIRSSSVAAQFYVLTNSEGSSFSTSSPAFVIFCLFDNSRSKGCEVIPYCGLDLHSSDGSWCWVSSFIYEPVGHLYLVFGKMPIQVFDNFKLCNLLFLLLSCKKSLSILDNNPSSAVWFANIPPIL